MPAILPSPDAVVHPLRQLIVPFGHRLRAFETSVCACSDPECIYHDPERFPLHLLLQETAEAAQGLRTPPADEPPDHRELRSALLALGERFGLFRCPCDEPTCPTSAAPTAALGDLLYVTFVQWYGLSGCVGRDGPEQAARGAEIGVRNLHLLQAWTNRLPSVPRVFLEEAVRSYPERSTVPWAYEARTLGAECLDHWIPHHGRLPEVAEAMDLVLLIAENAEWPDEDAALWMQLANDAMIALLLRDLADPAVTDAMYAGMEPLVPLRGLRTDVVTGRTGAYPGFYSFAA